MIPPPLPLVRIPSTSSLSNWVWVFLIILVVLVPAIIIGLVSPASNFTQTNPSPDLGPQAWFAGRDFINDNVLKAPSTAKFSKLHWDERTGWKQIGTNESWFVFGFVDAQNSFGAVLRNDWSVVVGRTNSTFSILAWKLGEQSSGS